MKQTIQFVLLLLAGALFASAQNAIPINPATIDYFTLVTQQLDNLLLSGVPVLVNLGLNIVNGFGLTVFLLLMIRWTFQHFAHHHVHFNVYPLLGFFFLVAFVDTLLYYYANPLPGLGVGLARFPSEVARQISGFLDLQVYNALLERVHNLTVNLQQPTGLFDLMGMFVYACVFINILFLDSVLFLVTIFGFIFYALTALVGPIFISFLLFPALKQYFHSWLSTLLRFAFYRIAASALVFVWANVMITVIDTFLGGNYSLANAFGMTVPFTMMNVALLVASLRLPAWVDNVFGGFASAGHGGLVPGMVTRLF